MNDSTHNKNKKRYNNKRNNQKRNSSKNRRPKGLSPGRLLQKYDNLLEQHLVARRKYFEMHARSSGKQLEKLVQNVERTLSELRKFESGAENWQKEILDNKINPYPEDNQYSKEHELAEVEYVPFDGDYEDPHLLVSQKNLNWAEDTEESSGSMEDYYNYKGIDAPVVINESDADKRSK